MFISIVEILDSVGIIPFSGPLTPIQTSTCFPGRVHLFNVSLFAGVTMDTFIHFIEHAWYVIIQ